MGVSILINRFNPYNNLQFNKLQEFHSFGDMLIGSIKPLQAPYLKNFLFARRSEKSFSNTYI